MEGNQKLPAGDRESPKEMPGEATGEGAVSDAGDSGEFQDASQGHQQVWRCLSL